MDSLISVFKKVMLKVVWLVIETNSNIESALKHLVRHKIVLSGVCY